MPEVGTNLTYWLHPLIKFIILVEEGTKSVLDKSKVSLVDLIQFVCNLRPNFGLYVL